MGARFLEQPSQLPKCYSLPKPYPRLSVTKTKMKTMMKKSSTMTKAEARAPVLAAALATTRRGGGLSTRALRATAGTFGQGQQAAQGAQEAATSTRDSLNQELKHELFCRLHT